MKKSNRIIYLPLENIDSRYSRMMNQELAQIADLTIYPQFDYPPTIEKGQFLDINKTCIFKAMQLQMVAEMFYKGEIKDGDSFLIADIFFPGIESLRYMSELQNIKILMFGFNYAGRADKTDFVQGLGKWADRSEHGYHDCMDLVFVGSEFHKANLLRYFFGNSQDEEKYIKVTGYIWNTDYCNQLVPPPAVKEDFVIWPHRICKEKGYMELLDYADATDKKIVVTSSSKFPNKVERRNIEYHENLTKKQYYGMMARARWYLSTAYQETFGYTLQEAIFYGCEIAIPHRACYPEMVPFENLYKDLKDIDSTYKKVDLSFTNKWSGNTQLILNYINEYKTLIGW